LRLEDQVLLEAQERVIELLLAAQNKVFEILRTKTANIPIKFKAKLVARELED
jgi:hypothetical protein